MRKKLVFFPHSFENFFRATESPSEVGGSFDSSGAFHGLNSDEEECVVSTVYYYFGLRSLKCIHLNNKNHAISFLKVITEL